MNSAHEFLRRVQEHSASPSRIFLRYQSKQLTFHDFSASLSDVASILRNGPELPWLVFIPKAERQLQVLSQLICLGVPALCLSSDARFFEIEQYLSAFPFAGLIVDDSEVTKFRTLKDRFPIRKEATTQLFDFRKIHFLFLNPPLPLPQPQESMGWLLQTSGSTGQPKLVVLSPQNLWERTLGEIALFEIAPHSQLLNLLAFSHDLGLNQLLTALAAGCELEVLPRCAPADWAQAIADRPDAGITGMPVIWNMLLSAQDHLQLEFRHRSFLTISGGSLPPGQIRHLSQLFPYARILKTYGQTETFRTLAAADPKQIADENAGSPIAGVEVLLINEAGETCAPGEVGELVHFGAGTMSGYWLDAEFTATKQYVNSRGQRGVRTGDYFQPKTGGGFQFKGRKDDLIKIGGRRVHLLEIETCLQEFDSVLEVCVLPISEPRRRREYLVAFVIPKRGQSVTARELKSWCLGQMTNFKCPQDFIFCSEFPRTASNKTDRRQLLADYQKENSTEVLLEI